MKAGLVGCGRMGAFTSEAVRQFAPACWFPLSHAEAISVQEHVDLVGLCDSHLPNLDRAAALYPTAQRFNTYQSMLDQCELDLVALATRTLGRAAMMLDAAASGVRALHVEKPLCNSLAELERLKPLFEDPEMFITLGAIRRHMPVFREARQIVSAGELGDLQDISLNLGQGALYWSHPHSVDLALFYAWPQRPVVVQAHLGGVELDDGCPSRVTSDPTIVAASIWFNGGIVTHIGRTPGCDVILGCKSGTVAVRNDGHALEVSQGTHGNPYFSRSTIDVADAEGPMGTAFAISQLVGCLFGRDEAIQGNAIVKSDILLGQSVLFAMVESHLQGNRPVDIGNVRPGLEILARSGDFFA
jgi:scyllo-inositol 2-dehydrogenase (NAD+)